MNRPPHYCMAPGCSVLVSSAPRCAAHTSDQRREADARRDPEVRRLYQSRQWLDASRTYRAQHPLCVRCGGLAQVVDHITPHRGDPSLFWQGSNWQSLCKRCHDRKTMTEDRTVPPTRQKTSGQGPFFG